MGQVLLLLEENKLPRKRLSVRSHDANAMMIATTTTATTQPAIIGAMTFSFSLAITLGAWTTDVFMSDRTFVTKPEV